MQGRGSIRLTALLAAIPHLVINQEPQTYDSHAEASGVVVPADTTRMMHLMGEHILEGTITSLLPQNYLVNPVLDMMIGYQVMMPIRTLIY
ncbi:hypothetical protein [Legionella hackeliae]|uniref:Uncharacterized protein n=1 Tax=Legionella hackeliae TaxID=449 RepID=A0A0A8UV84_LEGHA|nr:hypothetical protein [Legionella hackeliae]KTD09656.1 hypothetical protein Lhac_2024 [Legionella hackeliae]CEK11027.1 protein of unknown function [Legionella hackeliae]STX47771.1 Uncharacterised protein [Legionella hackeliae]